MSEQYKYVDAATAMVRAFVQAYQEKVKATALVSSMTVEFRNPDNNDPNIYVLEVDGPHVSVYVKSNPQYFQVSEEPTKG
jgi:hypothetical protein